MPKVSIELYINDVADDVCVAIIPKDKLPVVRQQFNGIISEILFKNEDNNTEAEG
jgi:hypothetical protein